MSVDSGDFSYEIAADYDRRDIEPKIKGQNNNITEKTDSNPYEFDEEPDVVQTTSTPNEDVCQCCGEDITTAHRGVKFSCVMCKKYYKNKDSLNTHVELYHSNSQEAIQCDKCMVKCANRQIYIEHTRSHNKNDLFECFKCKKTFTRKYQLNRHNRQTGCDGTEVDQLPCQVCGKVFARKDNLKDHLRNHVIKGMGKKSYKCDTCLKEFKAKSSLITHIRIHTNEYLYECFQCDRKCRTKAALVKHERRHTGDKPFKCKLCRRSFAAKEVLNRHIKTHSDKKPIACEICDKTFIQMTQLRAHMFYHTGECEFQCKYCDMKLQSKVKLLHHERFVHEGAPKLQCTAEGCNKQFKLKESLRRHMLVHSDERLFPCSVCMKRFRTRIHLKSHERTHRREAARSCLKCPRAFIRGDCLLRHMRLKHPEDYEMLKQLTYQSKLEKIKARLSQRSAATGVKCEVSTSRLRSNIHELLGMLVDENSLKLFGWPDCSVGTVLEAAIVKCGHKPVDSANKDDDDVLRSNVKILLIAVIDDDAIDELIKSHPIDEVITKVLSCGTSA